MTKLEQKKQSLREFMKYEFTFDERDNFRQLASDLLAALELIEEAELTAFSIINSYGYKLTTTMAVELSGQYLTKHDETLNKIIERE